MRDRLLTSLVCALVTAALVGVWALIDGTVFGNVVICLAIITGMTSVSMGGLGVLEIVSWIMHKCGHPHADRDAPPADPKGSGSGSGAGDRTPPRKMAA